MNHAVIIECDKSQLTRKEGGIRASVCALNEDLFIALEKVWEMNALSSLSGDSFTCPHEWRLYLNIHLHTHLNQNSGRILP